jgi:hypothetical protein
MEMLLVWCRGSKLSMEHASSEEANVPVSHGSDKEMYVQPCE